ncbi:hypothetical protein [Sutcliffiella cohnii]|uniref:hypothetical protein n=1 Tax=Sutcliffiella cohnii TaxID=33932 RepID=UPI002E1D26CE|nr:hypothetical protein [Sutcliffiella cohnii]
MILRKIIAFILTSLLVPLFLVVWGGDFSIFWGMYGVFLMYGTPFILLYGMPVTFLAERLTRNMQKRKRLAVSFGIHLLFGLVCVFIVGFIFKEPFGEWGLFGGILFIGSTLASIILWSVDELLRKLVDWESIQSAM